jgi:hypothetical protein
LSSACVNNEPGNYLLSSSSITLKANQQFWVLGNSPVSYRAIIGPTFTQPTEADRHMTEDHCEQKIGEQAVGLSQRM